MALNSLSLQRIAAISILLSVVVLLLKVLAYYLTGSAALYSDAIESIVNVVAGVMAFVAVSYSALPPDAKHPYGHGKVEYLSAVVEGVFIVAAACMIIYKAWQALLDPPELVFSIEAIAVSVFASVLNGVWALVLIRTARRAGSPALDADGRHLLSDVVSSVGVLIGLVLVVLTGWAWLDVLIAVLVALHILWAGWHLMQHSLAGLLDEAAPEEDVRALETIICERGVGAIQAHAIKSRWSAKTLFVEFHLVVPGAMSVSEAHAICDRLEEGIQKVYASSQVIIHVEPEGEEEQMEGVRISPRDMCSDET